MDERGEKRTRKQTGSMAVSREAHDRCATELIQNQRDVYLLDC